MLVIVPPEQTISFQESIPGVPTLDESKGETAMVLRQDDVLHYITYLVADAAPTDFPGFGAYCPDICPHLVAAFKAHIVPLDARQPLFRGSALPIVVLDDQLFMAQNGTIYTLDIPWYLRQLPYHALGGFNPRFIPGFSRDVYRFSRFPWYHLAALNQDQNTCAVCWKPVFEMVVYSLSDVFHIAGVCYDHQMTHPNK